MRPVRSSPASGWRPTRCGCGGRAAGRACRRSRTPTGSTRSWCRPSTSCAASARSPGSRPLRSPGSRVGTTPTTRASATRASRPSPTAPTSSSSTWRRATRPATRATRRRRCARWRTGTRASSAPSWPRSTATFGRGGCSSCPTTRRRRASGRTRPTRCPTCSSTPRRRDRAASTPSAPPRPPSRCRVTPSWPGSSAEPMDRDPQLRDPQLRNIHLRELLVGIEGLALLRRLLVGDDEEATARIAEVRRLVDEAGDAAFGLSAAAPELGVRDGYAAWSATYDEPGNPLIGVEQPAVWAVLDAARPGRALDAACGTGRHARRLADRGHRVVGVDGSPEMLARAQAQVPEGHFSQGDLRDLPLPSDAFDVVVCALAFDHVADLAQPVAELARVLRPGGRLVVSDVHPVLTSIGVAAYFRAP